MAIVVNATIWVGANTFATKQDCQLVRTNPRVFQYYPKTQNTMARPAIEIVSDAKRKIDKERQRGDFRPAPYFDAQAAAGMCDPTNYDGNNKSEWIKKLATAAAYILCEIETIQAIKGDGIYQR